MIFNVAWFLWGSPWIRNKNGVEFVLANSLPRLAFHPSINRLYNQSIYILAKCFGGKTLNSLEREKSHTWYIYLVLLFTVIKNIIRLFKFVLKHEQNSKQHINFWPFVTKTIITFCREFQTTWNFHRWILDSKGYRIHRWYAQIG